MSTDYSAYASIKEQILSAVETRLNTMEAGEPIADPYAFKFSIVQRQTIKEAALKNKKFVAAIFDSIETKLPDTDPVIRLTIDVDIELMAYVEAGQNPSTMANLMLSEVERRLKEDRTFGGLAIDCKVIRTEVDIDGRFDKYAEALLSVSILTRHNNNDPRSLV